MVVEIAAGWWFNSMAHLADSWHMGLHALSIGLTAFAYAASRRCANVEVGLTEKSNIYCIDNVLLTEGPLILPADLSLADDSFVFNAGVVESCSMRDAICGSLANADKNVTHDTRDLGVS